MRKGLLLLFVLLVIFSYDRFRRTLQELRNYVPEKLEKFQDFLSNKQSQNNETHRLADIAVKVNKLKTTWTATEYQRDYTPLLGALFDDLNSLPGGDVDKHESLPEKYDAREAYPKGESIREIRDQANCNSCWAVAAAETMSDRICIKSKQKDQRRISAQDLLSCCTSCGNSCNPGSPAAAWNYWKTNGIVTGGEYGDKKYCKPYFLPRCDHTSERVYGACPRVVDAPGCEKNCNNGNKQSYTNEMTKASKVYAVSGEDKIMQEILNNGPVEATITVYEDFLTYKKGIYKHVYGNSQGGHAIKIIGWGVEKGTKYWLVANSWNENWGEKGFFRILRGNNECGIERMAYTGIPRL